MWDLATMNRMDLEETARQRAERLREMVHVMLLFGGPGRAARLLSEVREALEEAERIAEQDGLDLTPDRPEFMRWYCGS